MQRQTGTSSIRGCCTCSGRRLRSNESSRPWRSSTSLTPERLSARIPAEQQRFYAVAAHTFTGLSALQEGRIDTARSRLHDQAGILHRDSTPEFWWHKLLEGEIALAQGDPQKAAAAFLAGEPQGKMWLHLNSLHVPLLANNLLSRDGAARAAKARGDLPEAIRIYRHLLTVGPKQKWTAMYEPRYVLEIARLLEQSGDMSGALKRIRTVPGVLEKRRQRSARACRIQTGSGSSALVVTERKLMILGRRSMPRTSRIATTGLLTKWGEPVPDAVYRGTAR